MCALSSFLLSSYIYQATASLNSPLAQVDFTLLADKVGEASSNTADSAQSIHNLLLSIDVGVQQTDDVSKVLRGEQSLQVFVFSCMDSLER